MSKLKGASRFAHLLGGRARAAEDDDEKDEKDSKSKAESGDDDEKKDDDKDGKSKSKAEDDEDDDAKAADGDDDTDDEDEKDKDKASARARERGRCAAIFASRHAGANPAAAAELAFGTTLKRSAAIRLLSTMAATAPAPAARRLSVDDRMRSVATPPLASEGQGEELKPHQRLARHAEARRGKAS